MRVIIIKVRYFIKSLLPIITAFLIISSFFASDVIAQKEDNSTLQNETDSYLRFSPSCSVKDISGKVRIIETESEYSHELKIFGKLPVRLAVGSQYIDIKDSVPVRLPSRLVGWTTDIETTFPFFKFNETYVRLGISPSFYADDWDFGLDAFRLPSRCFLIYRPTDKWIFIGGLALYLNYKNSGALLPILGFIYKPTERLTFEIIPQRPNISYALNKHVSLFAEGDISAKEFDVDRADSKDVVLKYKEWHVGGGTEIKFNKFFRLSATAGGIFDRTLKYSDKRAKVAVKDGFYTELKLRTAF